MNYSFKTSGTCATGITFDIDDDKKITNVKFQGGCDGNLKAIGILVDGKSAEEISSALKGNTCGFKKTSCADQLAIAVTEAAAKIAG
jgi:uncharacterized protein (TIGR03905 family)